jgi:hypothetical protein
MTTISPTAAQTASRTLGADFSVCSELDKRHRHYLRAAKPSKR